MSLPKFRFSRKHRFISFLWNSFLPGKGTLSRLFAGILIPKPSGECIIETLHDCSLVVDPLLDSGVEKNLYYFGTYEFGTLRFLKHYLRPGDVFVDVGANIGLMSVIASTIVAGNGKVFSFEPNPQTAKILRRNVTLNHCSNISVIEKAVGNSAGTITIYDNWEVNRGGATLVPPKKLGQSSKVEIVRLDDYPDLQLLSPAIIKVDVEGFELDVLMGMKDLLLKPAPPALIVECSSERNNNYKSVDQIYDFIVNLNQYHIFRLSRGKERTGKLIRIASRLDIPEHDNIYCLPLNQPRIDL